MAHEQDSLNRPSHAGTTSTSTASATAIPPGATSDQIRQKIDRTRADMDETVDALGNRLQPRHLLDELLDYFKGKGGSSSSGASQTLRDGASGVLDRVKDHPMPAVLIGAGLAWMFFEGDKTSRTRAGRWDSAGRHGDIGNWRNLPEHSGSVVDARTGQPYDEASYDAGARSQRRRSAQGASIGMNSAGTDLEASGAGGAGMVDKAKDKLATAGDALGDAASSARDSITGALKSSTGAASDAAESAADYARSARDAGYDYGHRAYDATGRGYDAARNGLASALDEYPLISGVAALAVGAVAGLLLPATRRENQLMGEYSDELKAQAQHKGEELYSQGKAVAKAATSAVTDAADESGVAPGSLAEKAKHVARDVGDAVSRSSSKLVDDVKQVAKDATGAAADSAKREGLEPGQLKDTAKDIASRAKDAATEEAHRQKNRPQR